MPITASCPGCGQTLAVQDQFAGKQGKCPSCNTIVTFPSTEAIALAPLPVPAASAAPGPLAPPAMPGPPAAAVPAAPRAPLDPLVLTFIGLGAATFFFFLLLISVFLNWRSGVEVAMLDIRVAGVPGIFFGDGRMLFCLTLVMLVGVALNFVDRRFLPQCIVVAGAFATFVVLMMLGRIGSGTAGVLLGFFAGVGAAGACIWTAVRQPFVLDTPLIKGGQSFFRTYGALLAAEAVAFGFGVLYWLLRAIFAAA